MDPAKDKTPINPPTANNIVEMLIRAINVSDVPEFYRIAHTYLKQLPRRGRYSQLIHYALNANRSGKLFQPTPNNQLNAPIPLRKCQITGYSGETFYFHIWFTKLDTNGNNQPFALLEKSDTGKVVEHPAKHIMFL